MLLAGMGNGSGVDLPEDGPVTAVRATSAPSVLETLATTFGSVPRVLLRDTADGETPAPIIRPSSGDDPSIRYRIDGEIARGGMGAILKGRDPDLGRDVALKVLREDLRDNTDMVRRFVEEAQIGGQLQHPGIVPIYELGTFADKRPFFSMKLVKGQTLADQLASRSGPADDLPRLLSIYAAIAQTMAYSHTRGVIHRDLKPSNVMVGNFGEVQVMDWGLAKVLARGGVVADAKAGKEKPPETMIATARSSSGLDLSHAGSILGTPSYMAPEQARGETELINERADVFALGSILCEILTGSPAFTGRSSGAIVRKASRGDTADALTRLDGCGAESELIALARACLAVEPEDRPRDANIVSERIAAYLAGVQERVQAAERERAVAVARAVEERRRRKVQLALAASVLALATLSGLSTTYYLQQRQARAAARQRVIDQVTTLQKQAVAQPEDIQRWEVALAAVEQADPAGDPNTKAQLLTLQKEIQAGLDATHRDKALLDRLVDIRSAEADDPDGSASDAAYAAAFRDAGIDVDALGPEAASAKITARPAKVALALTAALDDWAAQRRKAHPRDADAWKRLVATARVADPEPTRDRLRQFWSESDRKAHRQPLLQLAKEANPRGWPPASLTLLAGALDSAGEREAAADLLRRAQAEHPGDVWVNYNLARLLEQLHPPRTEEAIRFYSVARASRPETGHELAHMLESRGREDEAVVVFRNLTAHRPGNGRHWGCLSKLLQARGDREGSEAALEKAVGALQKAIRLEPVGPTAHNNLGVVLCDVVHDFAAAISEFREAIRLGPEDALAHDNLANALRGQGKLAGAIAEYREAIRLKPDYANVHYNLGNALSDQGKLAEAIAAYREAIRLTPDYAEAHNNLGLTLHDQGKLAEAIAAYREAIRLKPNLAMADYNLGAVLCDVVHDYAVAEAEFREAIRLKLDDIKTHTGLGLALHGQGKVAEAIAEYRKAIRLKSDDANAHYNLGRALSDQGKVAEAIAEYREAIRLKPDLAMAHNNLGVTLHDQGRLAEAIAEYREAIRLKPDLTMARLNLGNALHGQGKVAEAMAEYREAIRLKPDDANAHYNLGRALSDQGEVAEAIAAYREAIRLKPDLAMAHCNLGLLLRQQGQFREALAELRRGHELGSKRPGWPYPSAEWVRQAERMAALDARLPAILKGDDHPADAGERLTFAELCCDRKLHAAATRLYAEALQADPKLADDRQAGHRYNAACSAALAAAGKGKDDPSPDEAAKAKLRRHALDLLKAELAVWSKLDESGPPQARPVIVQTLKHWQEDADLAGIREAKELAKLLEDERKAWQSLWADVEALLKRTAGRKS
jgi:serine/threonine-protein kinase